MIRKKACFLSGFIFSRDLAAEPGKAVFIFRPVDLVYLRFGRFFRSCLLFYLKLIDKVSSSFGLPGLASAGGLQRTADYFLSWAVPEIVVSRHCRGIRLRRCRFRCLSRKILVLLRRFNDGFH